MAERVWVERLTGWIAWNQEEIASSVRLVGPGLVHVRPSTRAPSVGFHAWHVGRWVDRQRVALAGWMDPTRPELEVWIERDLQRTWGLAGRWLGDFGGTGAGLDDDASAALALPDVAALLDYVLATFSAFEATLGRIEDDRTLARFVVDLYGEKETIADVLLNHLSHADRHLGMIEALRGVLGERGTATV